jgi:UPF0755 protein
MNKGFLVGLTVVVLAAVGGGLFLKKRHDEYEKWRWAKIGMSEAMARVPANWSIETLATRLQKSGKIRETEAFKEAAAEIDLQTALSGAYQLPKTANPRDLAQIFKAGPTHQQVTFPEGFTGIQMAKRLTKNGFNGAEFERIVYPANSLSPYEGTLFPETYWLPVKGDGATLTKLLNAEFKNKIQELKGPFPTVKGKTLTLREVVILASLVEREAVDAKEMPKVAGVIIARLNTPMRLQIDATVQYARVLADEGHKPRLDYSDLKIDSPYNTYQIDGLPPAPICNPGMDALRAAAKPAKIEELFYVYSPKLRHHRFAKTYSEHLKNVRLANKERAEKEKTS